MSNVARRLLKREDNLDAIMMALDWLAHPRRRACRQLEAWLDTLARDRRYALARCIVGAPYATPARAVVWAIGQLPAAELPVESLCQAAESSSSIRAALVVTALKRDQYEHSF